jgi:hypothetical protein
MAIEPERLPGMSPTPEEQAVAKTKLVKELLGRATFHIDCANRMVEQAEELLNES